MIKNKIRIGSIFAALLLISVVFAPAVMAQSESTNATEISNSVLISNEDIKKTLENTNEISINMKVLKETDNEKVVSIKKDDGANAAAAASVGFLVATAISHVYWNEQNRNGSLDILIPYTSIAKKAIYQPANVKIGKRWYSV